MLYYYPDTYGTFDVWQKQSHIDEKTKEWVDTKDEKGKQVYNKYTIQMRAGNCMVVFMHIYKMKEPQDPKKPWMHQLITFFGDEQHIKNCQKEFKTDLFGSIFGGEIHNVKLNMYYSNSNKLLKYFVKDGLKVTCYYKEPKTKKGK